MEAGERRLEAGGSVRVGEMALGNHLSLKGNLIYLN